MCDGKWIVICLSHCHITPDRNICINLASCRLLYIHSATAGRFNISATEKWTKTDRRQKWILFLCFFWLKIPKENKNRSHHFRIVYIYDSISVGECVRRCGCRCLVFFSLFISEILDLTREIFCVCFQFVHWVTMSLRSINHPDPATNRKSLNSLSLHIPSLVVWCYELCAEWMELWET